MEKGLISVIVPVYGVEQYLRCCLESIANQSYTNFECICVDDGSPDNSYKILQEYCTKDPRFSTVRTQNRGVSAARNEGIDRARGEYIAFIDGDDFIYFRFLEQLQNDITLHHTDIACCGFQPVTEGAKYFSTSFQAPPHHNSFSSSSPLLSFFRQRELVNVVVWNKLYLADLVKKHRFSEELPCAEDDMFTYQVLCSAKKIACNPAKLVSYRNRKSSLSKNYNSDAKFKFACAFADFAQHAEGLTAEEHRSLKKKAVNVLYRETIKTPFRAQPLVSQETIASARERLLSVTNKGQIDYKSLCPQYRMVCWLVKIGQGRLAVILVCGRLFNWKL
ncbi:glycosyltransferase family 2 protein [Desulfosediminicola ganghwensis]|uniref:glycosyltransferase family 2 protein n=1 Tax=Desulfosediminicola ganghwensis TaxID=2569540 RepID=UPI00142ECEFD|nr:glycosyltransferase family 2 protein [Desulfosediminicola ganghwensis]